MQPDPHLQRLDRCFVQGSNKENVRQLLRVLAGVRRHDGDEVRLSSVELQTLLANCPELTRCAGRARNDQQKCPCRPWISEIASTRNITSESPVAVDAQICLRLA
jgi:hypothetical protein